MQASMRKFIAITMFLSAIIMLISSLVLFFAPGSTQAALMGWNILGIIKPEFKLMHKIFGITLILCASTHIWFNRKALMNYVKSVGCNCPVSRPARLSLILVVVLFVAAIVFGK